MIRAIAEDKKVTINIHDEVGESWFSSSSKEEGNIKNVEQLQKILNEHKDANLIDIYINSPGGDVFEGIGIYNILKRNRAYKRVYVDGFACSIASVIAMAGNSISMPKSSMQMIHNAYTYAIGNAAELRKAADDLDKINETIVQAYMSKFKGTENELRNLLDAESYLTADECLKYGLCTKIVEDGESTEGNVNASLDATTKLYANKLKQLERIKACLHDLNVEIAPKETVKEPEGETVEEIDAVNETYGEMKKPEKPVKATEAEVKKIVEESKATALQKFFNYDPEKEKKE